MEKSTDVQPTPVKTQPESLVLSAEEKKHIADFLSVLIQIDHRVNITNSHGQKPN